MSLLLVIFRALLTPLEIHGVRAREVTGKELGQMEAKSSLQRRKKS